LSQNFEVTHTKRLRPSRHHRITAASDHLPHEPQRGTKTEDHHSAQSSWMADGDIRHHTTGRIPAQKLLGVCFTLTWQGIWKWTVLSVQHTRHVQGKQIRLDKPLFSKIDLSQNFEVTHTKRLRPSRHHQITAASDRLPHEPQRGTQTEDHHLAQSSRRADGDIRHHTTGRIPVTGLQAQRSGIG
ncbi:Hypothetical predicted protein, partial [Pelobates cultripes]